jgi:ribosomal protein S18 acetylase RimI-like enzyme
MIVRACRESDFKTIRYICHATATAKQFKDSMKLVTTLYCDYYIEREPENCFVLCDEFDKPAGYILCSSNDEKFQRDYKPYIKKAKKLSFFDAVSALLEQKITKKEREKFPAHLHIDILPSFQSKGGGRMLVEALLAHLKEKGVKGVRLGVGQANTGAVAFYERMGFKRVRKISHFSYIYAMEL